MTLAVVVSGAAGLIFQMVWLYECGLAFGNSLWSATIVLSSFMCGLALGNAIVAVVGRRLSRPLIAYATLEGVVALSGVTLTYLLPHSTSEIARLTAAAGSSAGLVNAVRLGAAFALLVVPTTAMGATLPVLVGALARDPRHFGRVLGHLYGWNTLGAVVGVVVAEVVLIRYLGVRGTGWAAAMLDVAAAGLAIRAAQAFKAHAAAPKRSERHHGAPASAESRSRRWALLLSAALAGGILLALEVVWFRFLTMFVLSTTLTVSVMLAVVLAAIGAGGLAASLWLGSREDGPSDAPAVAFLAGGATVLAYSVFGSITSGTQIGEWHRVLWLACALVVPTSFLSGVLFTLIGGALERAMPDAGHTRAAAALTLANTLGAMCGAPMAAFVLLPALGMEGAFFTLAFVYGLVAALSFFGSRRHRVAVPIVALAVAGLAFAFAIVAFPFGRMLDRYVVRSASAYTGDGSTIVATREGASDTVFLMRQSWLGQPVYDRLVTDGFSMTGTAVPGMRYMRAFAYWPLLMHQAPLKRALVICYGLGVTLEAVNDIASLDSIDVVEISKDVLAMSDVVYAGGKAPLKDPRVRLHVEDGRNFLQSTSDRFDLITGEPPPPRTPGTVSIYTREYFQLLYDHLADGGMATYWLPVARPSPGTDIDTVARAFCDVFTDCSLWNATPFDLMLVGGRQAVGPLSEERFRQPWVTPGLEAHLREVGFEQPEEIGATFLGDAAYVRELTRTAPPLVDDFPQRLVPSPSRISLSDPRYGADPAVAELFQKVIDPARARTAFATSAWVKQWWPASLREKTLPAFEYQRIINRVLWDGGRPLRQIEDLHFLLTHTTLRTLPLWVLGSDEVKQRIAESNADRSGAVEYARALRAFTGHGYAAAEAYLAEAEKRGFGGAQVRALRAYALCMSGDLEQARVLAQTTQAADLDEEHFWQWIKTRIASGGFAN